jgi:hypothetical protein
MSKFWRYAGGTVAVIVGLSVLGNISRSISSPSSATLKKDVFERQMELGIQKLKTELPMKVDSATTIVDVALVGKTLTYKALVDITGPALEDGFTKKDINDARETAQQSAAEMLCKTPLLRSMLVDYGYTATYKIWSTGNKFLFDYQVAGHDCPTVKTATGSATPTRGTL